MTANRISWSNPRVLAALLLVFLCGASAGALTLRVVARQQATKPTGLQTESKKDIVVKFQKELELSSVQVEKVEIILDDYMKYMHDLQAQMDDVRVHGKEMIRKVLNEEQKQKFDKMIAAAQPRSLR